MNKTIFVTLILALLIPSAAISAPDTTGVSGTISEGQTVVLSGSDFGVNDLNFENTHDNIEAGSAGSEFSRAGWDFVTSSQWQSTYSTTDSHSGSQAIHGHVVRGGVTAAMLQFDIDRIDAGDFIYLTYWVNWDGDTTGNQWKMLRFVEDHNDYSDQVNTTYLSNWFGGADTIISNPASSYDDAEYVSSRLYPEGGWERMEVELTASSIGVSNGVINITSTTDDGTITNDGWTESPTHPLSDSAFNYLVFQNYMGNGSGSADIYTDDIYISYTKARVELCEGATWNSRGVCEIQNPTAWATDQVTVKLNQGAFSTDDQAYLYVVDSNGAANTLGEPVTIDSSGGSNDTTPATISLLAPTGTLSNGTTSTTISHITNEAATCRYSTTSGVAYASMVGEYETSLSASHSADITGLTNGSTYNYYVRCVDGAGNVNTSDANFSFNVAASAGAAGSLAIEYPAYSVDRDIGRIPINIVRTGGSTGEITVDWSSNGQSATHNIDYYGNDDVTETFADGVTIVSINTYGAGDDGIELIDNGATSDRYFQLILSNVTGGATLGSPALSTVTIRGEGDTETVTDLGTTWSFWGDSQTDGRAPTGSCESSPDCVDSSWTATSPTSYIEGLSGRSLANTAIAYGNYGSKAGLTWVHVQESGGQNNTGQTTASEFGITFEALMADIHTDSPDAVISYETAFSFGRESEDYRDWTGYNAQLYASVVTLESQGIDVVVADVDSKIKALQSAKTPSDVWYQDGDANEYHYTALGNFMVAMTVLDALGHDVNNLDLSNVTDVAAGDKAIVLDLFDEPVTNPGTFSLASSTYSVSRSSGNAYITINRTGGSDGVVAVEWTTLDQTATHSVDYSGGDNVPVSFGDGVTSQQITIPLIDNGAEESRHFYLDIDNASAGAGIGSPSSATITILGTESQVGNVIQSSTGTPVLQSEGTGAVH